MKIVFFKGSVVHLLLTSRQFQNHFLKCFLCPTSDLHSFLCFTLLSPKTFPTCSLKNVQKNYKIHFQTLRTFVFDFKVASKPISKILPLANFKMKPYWRLRFAFSQNGFNFVPPKFTKKVQNITFEPSEQSFFTFRQLQNHFLKSFERPTLDLMFGSIFCIFEGFDFLFRKMVSWYNFVFDLKVASDLLSKIVPIPNLCFNQFSILSIRFPRKPFQFRHSKICKEAKISFMINPITFATYLKLTLKRFPKMHPMIKF